MIFPNRALTLRKINETQSFADCFSIRNQQVSFNSGLKQPLTQQAYLLPNAGKDNLFYFINTKLSEKNRLISLTKTAS